MKRKQESARLDLIKAAVNLIDWSGLAVWQLAENCFQPSAEHEFVKRQQSRGEFGRLISWLVFSVGAEYLAKGVCLANNIVVPAPKPVLGYPPSGVTMDGWARNVLRGKAPKMSHATYGTLADYYGKKSASGYFHTLRQKRLLSDGDYCLLVAAYRLLAGAIRNRDVHTYVPNERGGHFYLVAELFVPCFNMLLKTLPDGARNLASRYRCS